MHPAIAKLLRMVPPPAQPNGTTGDWTRCERELQLRLPEDYKEFISAYGSGTLCGAFEILSPFDSPQRWQTTVRGWWENWATIYDAWNAVTRERTYPHYPAVPGLLPWGTYYDANILSWYTAGEPERWGLVYLERHTGFVEVPGLGFAEFLVAALTGTVPLPEHVFRKQVPNAPFTYDAF